MRSRHRLLRQLLVDGMYVVDELAVANAIVARAVVRLTVPESPFYNALRGSQAARSFRHDPGARSFRLARSPSLRRALH
jgi:hypothetical protein